MALNDGHDSRDTVTFDRRKDSASHLALLETWYQRAPVGCALRRGSLHHEVNFLQKPFSPHALAAKVREVLA